MSSFLRRKAHLTIPDQNSARKCTHLWFNRVYNPDTDNDDYKWFRFSCSEGVYEFTGDIAGNTPADIFDGENFGYEGVFAAKYLGGLRAVTDFGPNLRNLLSLWLGGSTAYASSIRVITPGDASRVQILDSGINYGSDEYMVEAIIDGGINGAYINSQLSNGDYINPLADIWIVKNPVAFSIDNDGTYEEYFYVNPLGDDVYSHDAEPYISGRGARGTRSAAPTLAQQKKKAVSLLKGFKPRNAAAAATLEKRVKALIAKAAPAAGGAGTTPA